MDRALETGVNFFDTANVYSGKLGEGITEQIIGPRTLQQYDEALPAATLQLSVETLAKLNEIWPGPGGEAPESVCLVNCQKPMVCQSGALVRFARRRVLVIRAPVFAPRAATSSSRSTHLTLVKQRAPGSANRHGAPCSREIG
jgi:hypothetical protein